MKNIYLLARRELLATFSSAIAWVFLTVFLLGNGFIFILLLNIASQPGAGSHTEILRWFFGGTIFYWLFVLAMIPLLTMRLIAEEKRTGTIESLLTAPVSDWEVILGKFFATLLFYIALWLPSVIYVGLMDVYGEVDWGPIAGGYLGIILCGAALIAIGVFTSSVSHNQIVAAVLCFVILLFVFALGILEYVFPNPETQEIFRYINIWTHMDDFTRGLIDSRRIVYDLSLTVAGLFLARSVLRIRQGR